MLDGKKRQVDSESYLQMPHAAIISNIISHVTSSEISVLFWQIEIKCETPLFDSFVIFSLSYADILNIQWNNRDDNQAFSLLCSEPSCFRTWVQLRRINKLKAPGVGWCFFRSTKWFLVLHSALRDSASSYLHSHVRVHSGAHSLWRLTFY